MRRASIFSLVSTGFKLANGAAIGKPQHAECIETMVVIIGAGVAGITAAQALHNQSIDDFLIVEYNDRIGGRLAHTNFGAKADGTPYVVELGANWVQGLGTQGGPENPIWTLAKKWGLTSEYSNYSSIMTYNETGYTDYASLLDEFEAALVPLGHEAGYMLTENIADQSMRAGLSEVGWTPRKNMAAQAVDWWEWDWETSFSPEESSQIFGVVGSNATFNQFSDENNYVFDPRGFSHFLQSEASTFLAKGDPRVMLSSPVTNITYSSTDVSVTTSNGTCVHAQHAILTVSVGVLQAALASPPATALTFSPELPKWKKRAISGFAMGTYTKIFLQFPPEQQFWDADTEFFLYADPTTRGYFPVWQSLSSPLFLKDSGVLFVTVVGPQSAQVEAQTDQQTLDQVLDVLRLMFGPDKVPQPTAFMYPRWGSTPWAFGSYSNWPTGVTLQQHQNLRSNVDRLWFAGEGTSAEYFGFLHGAWFEGKSTGERIAGCLHGNATACGEKRYEVVRGQTPEGEYSAENGWTVSSFLDYADN